MYNLSLLIQKSLLAEIYEVLPGLITPELISANTNKKKSYLGPAWMQTKAHRQLISRAQVYQA